jgi:hypothetical protein
LIIHGITCLVLKPFAQHTSILKLQSLSALGIGFIIFGLACLVVM